MVVQQAGYGTSDSVKPFIQVRPQSFHRHITSDPTKVIQIHVPLSMKQQIPYKDGDPQKLGR